MKKETKMVNGWFHLFVYVFMAMGNTLGILLIFLYNIFAGITVICISLVGICLNSLLYEANKIEVKQND